MKEIKIRIEDDELVEDIDLWLRSGQLRVSRTKLLEALLLAFGLVLIEGLREQRTRWAEAQREGSRKPVTSKKIAAKPPAGFKIKTPTI